MFDFKIWVKKTNSCPYRQTCLFTSELTLFVAVNKIRANPFISMKKKHEHNHKVKKLRAKPLLNYKVGT
jgi:hypothetical protein